MKKNIHPSYNKLVVTMTDGTTFETKSTMTTGTLRLDIDPICHPAWTGVHRLLNVGGQMARFNSRFKDFTTQKK
jgi:large subunit ribosomal protein L31